LNCLICLKALASKGEPGYHPKCLERLFGNKKIDLNVLDSRSELVKAMPKKTRGFSISGVQMKCQMAVEEGKLKLVDSGGHYIIKPSPEQYPNLAENEHTTLTLMSRVGFEVPPCGLLRLQDGHLVFIIQRYDRNFEDGSKVHQEDAMQALGISNRDSGHKYTSASYQEVLELAVKHAGLAVAMELLMRLVFSYAVGNDDHHLKNISFLYHPAFKLTPCYDILASALYSGKSENPMALRFLSSGQPSYYETMGNGFYTRCDFIELGIQAGLLVKACTKRIEKLVKNIEIEAPDIVRNSFMDPERQEDYLNLLNARLKFLKHLEKPDTP